MGTLTPQNTTVLGGLDVKSLEDMAAAGNPAHSPDLKKLALCR